jgi:hypothetical protein
VTAPYEYDVAFSFHSIDEGLAEQLNDLLQDRCKTFLYSKRQEVLVGTDGEQRFNSVFGVGARCVVVFYRKEWGETPFTRIEQTAIRNRAFTAGYDFTIVIPTETPPSVPPWLPKTRLWYGLSRFGLEGAAAVVEARVQELGGEPRIESVQDRAARLQRVEDFKKARKRFQDSAEGVGRANEAFGLLTEKLQADAAGIVATNVSLTSLKVRKIQDYWLISGLRVCVVVSWQMRYNNSLDGSVLRADTYTGVPRLPGLIPDMDEPRRLARAEFNYELIGSDRQAFVERAGKKRTFSPEELSDYLLRAYMDAAERYER